MRTGVDFKSAQFDHVRGETEDWIKMRGIGGFHDDISCEQIIT
jgi:hypothetical protein